ncbi:hypothetical protein ebA6437 [Aromatoleum aromaticum EbN1]|uniref:Uncharacterized protein n=1 Tax=Aromatoleum aromaticum (strain DSM 19018 / LMG 30748 / EbN1) TaxID=76114 RepID=Q5NYQ9_AROAE|nr:hypothetical protein ebA6437 [Aromatoleum aromaticum EbN1]
MATMIGADPASCQQVRRAPLRSGNSLQRSNRQRCYGAVTPAAGAAGRWFSQSLARHGLSPISLFMVRLLHMFKRGGRRSRPSDREP